MIYLNLDGYLPGTILKVRSPNFPNVYHYGGADWEVDPTGNPFMWHAQKNGVFQRTTFCEFSTGLVPEIDRTPQSREEQNQFIGRFRMLEGTRWNLLQANCEQQIRWAIEGRAYSTQLNGGLLALVSVAAIVGLAKAVR